MVFTIWVFLIAVASYVTLWSARAAYHLFFHPLSRYPGSTIAAISKPWYQWYWNFHHKGQLIYEMERLHAQYGPVIRIAPNELHINDPAVYQEMTRVGSNFNKDPSYYSAVAFPGTSIGECNPEQHRIRRQMLTPAFSPSRMQRTTIPLIKRCVDQLLARFEQYGEDQPVNLFRGAKALTMDVVSTIALGKPIGCLQQPEFENEFTRLLHGFLDAAWFYAAFPGLYTVIMSLPEVLTGFLLPLPYFKRKCLGLVNNSLSRGGVHIFDTEFDTPSAVESDWNPVVSLLRYHSNVKNSVLNDNELVEEVITLLAAGNDTASDVLILGTYKILRDYEVKQKLRDELRKTFPSLNEEITYEKVKQLPFMTAVVKEIMRVTHPIPGLAPRVVPSCGFKLYEHYLPGGIILNTSAYLLNRNPNIFQNPDLFSPSRWLAPDAKRLESHLATFYRGTRQCIGKDIAYCELYIFLANLFRKFDLEIWDTTDEDMKWIDLVSLQFTGKEFHVKLKKQRS